MADASRLHGLRSTGRRLLDSPVGPLALAVCFAALSIPLVAASFMGQWSGPEWRLTWGPRAFSLAWSDAFVLAAGSAMTAAAIAGGLGGLVVRRHPRLAMLIALGLSWPVGVSMLSVTASITGMDLGIVGGWCETGCDVEITSEAGSGLDAYVRSLPPAELAVAAGAVAIAAMLFKPPDRLGLFLCNLAIVIAFAMVDIFSLLTGGAVAFVCLAAGALAWVHVLVRPAAFIAANREPRRSDDTESEGYLTW